MRKVSTQIHQMVKTKRILIKLMREEQIAINFWWLCVQHKGIINLKTSTWRFQLRSNVFKNLACDYNVIWTELRYYSLASFDTSIIISLAFRVYAGMTVMAINWQKNHLKRLIPRPCNFVKNKFSMKFTNGCKIS